MIGKIILWILLGIVVLLAVLLLVPVKLRGAYREGEPFLSVQYGPVKIPVFPPKEKPPEKEKPPKKEKPGAEKPKKPKKPQKPKAKINADQIVYALEKLPPVLGRALKRTGKSIHIRPLQIYVLVAGSDPAATAALYGKLEAALAAGFPILEKRLHIQDADVRVYLDFTEWQMDLIVDVGVSFRPWSLVWMALRAGGSRLKWFIGFRRLASPPAPGTENTPKEPADGNTKKEHEAA
ncbi:MAG: hypothetical protein K2O84_00790 [Oscillospiraceae bacterium]|nr:hypothetical protein [Oscillospiraceae bacterium]